MYNNYNGDVIQTSDETSQIKRELKSESSHHHLNSTNV